ncbi:MAG: PQQ-binding-like beta-propeller repeat protein [Limisphaerales bacterium]
MNPTRSPILLAVASTLFLASAKADWPNYRGPNHDGKASEKLASHSFPSSGPREVWKTDSPGGFASLSVADGRAFTLVGRSIDGAPTEVLVALDAKSGKELWAVNLAVSRYRGGGDAGTPDNKGGDGPRSTPTVDGGLVYVLDGLLNLVCVEAASGKTVWRKDLLREHAGRNITWNNAASPVIDGDLVFVAGGGEGQSLLGIHKKTGAVVWKGEDDLMTHATPVATTIHGVRQILFFTQKGLVSVAPADGRVLWRQPFLYKTSTAASPIVAGDIVYCSAGYGVGAGAYRISKSGERFESTELWRMNGKLQNHWSTPIHHQGHLYGIFGFKEYGEAPLQCIELATGTVKWSHPGYGPGNVTFVDGHLLVLGDAGQLAIVEATPEAYREKAKADILAGKCWSTPSYTQGRVYARSTTEAVCIDLN